MSWLGARDVGVGGSSSMDLAELGRDEGGMQEAEAEGGRRLLQKALVSMGVQALL